MKRFLKWLMYGCIGIFALGVLASLQEPDKGRETVAETTAAPLAPEANPEPVVKVAASVDQRRIELLNGLVKTGEEVARACGNALTITGQCMEKCGRGKVIDAACFDECAVPTILANSAKVKEQSQRARELGEEARRSLQ